MRKRILILATTIILGITISKSVVATEYKLYNEKKNTDIIIVFDKNEIDNNIIDIIAQSGGTIIKEIPEIGGIEAECNVNLIPEIKSNNSVQSLSPQRIITINNNINNYNSIKENNYYEDNSNGYYEDNSNGYYEDNSNTIEENFSGNLYEKYQWDIKRVTNNGESFSLEYGNHDIVVGIIDSGVDSNHNDLKENFFGGKNFVPANFQDNNTEDGDINDLEDRFGHGTEVAGQIAANGKLKGIAPGIAFKSYRVFDEYGQTTASICADAIIEAVNDGVDVINLSFASYYLDGKCTWTDPCTKKEYDLGDDIADFSLLERAIKYATENDVVVVTASGNDGIDCSDNKKLTEYFNELYKKQGFNYTGLMYEEPGSFEGVINVSATNKSDKIASYSNYGEDFIDVTAPGGDVNEDFDVDEMCLTTCLEGNYTFVFGTSFAAPKVSAIAALIRCKYKDFNAQEVSNKIYNTVNIIDNNSSSKYYGLGLVNAYNALN